MSKKIISKNKPKPKANISPVVEQDFLSRIDDISLNPLTAMGYLARNQSIPQNLGKGIKSGAVKRNILDNPLDMLNPAFYLNSAQEGVSKVLDGNFKGAAGEAMNFVPAMKGPVGAVTRLGRQEKKLAVAVNGLGLLDDGMQFLTGKGIINDDESNNNINMKNKKTSKVPKFALGTTITDPSDALYKNQMNWADAQVKGASNGWVQGLKIGGNLAEMVGQGMMQQGLADKQGEDGKGVAGFLNKNSGAVNSGLNTANAIGNFFAMGGEVPGNIPVEVEGGEAGEMPNGQMVDFNGPTHEEGGIPTSLPVGTEMYSNRIKVDGVSIADKVKKGAKKEMRLEDLLSKAKGDSLLTNALNRTKAVNETEKANFQKIQDTVKQAMEGPSEVHAWGNTVGGGNPWGDYSGNAPVNTFDPMNVMTGDNVAKYTTNETPGAENNSTDNGITIGDAFGMAGNVYSTFAPMNNTLANRAGDKPNINAYANYGKDGLKTIDQAGQYLDMIKAQKQKDLALSRTSTMKSIDNSTRSLNVNRAMKLAADAGANNTNEQISNNFAEQMFGMANTKAGMQNQKDQVVMAGNQAKDLADREDRDNFFSQMGTDIATKGQGIQEMSYDLNKMKEGKEMTNLVNQLSKYGYKYNSKTGKIYMDKTV